MTDIVTLKDSHLNKECYIVSCGPSIKTLNQERLKYLLKDKLVISIKQAYNIIGRSDFHIYNFIHLQEYDYTDSPVTIELTRFGKTLTEPDIAAPINVREAGNYLASVATRRNFNDFLFEKTLQRPFGPGLLYEVGFYLAVHLGVSGITTIGFDSAQPNSHFYGDNADKPTEARMKLLQKEMNFVVAGMGSYHKWLKSKGIDWNIISDINPGPSFINRLTLDDIPEPA